MNRINTIVLLLFAANLIISCGKSELEQELEGTWTATTMNYNITQTNSIAGEGQEIIVEGDASGINYDLTFEEETYSASGSYTLDFKFLISGEETEFSQPTPEVSSEGTYSIDGNEMTASGDLYSFNFEGLGGFGLNGQSSIATIEINGDILIINQNQTFETGTTGLTVTTNIISESTWMRK